MIGSYLERINELEKSGVNIGISRRIIKHTSQRRYTFDSELTACEVLSKSFNPKCYSIRFQNEKDDALGYDIIIEGFSQFQVKRPVISQVEHAINNFIAYYSDIITKDDQFVQVIISYDENIGLDTIHDGDIKIHKIKGINGAEILFDMKIFESLVISKILKTYKKFKEKKNGILIIDVRNFNIPDYFNIYMALREIYLSEGFFILFLMNVFQNNQLIPLFLPLCYPSKKYIEKINLLKESISFNATIVPRCCVWKINDRYYDKFNPFLNRDADGYLIYRGKKICKSLTGNEVMITNYVLTADTGIDGIYSDKGSEMVPLNFERIKFK